MTHQDVIVFSGWLQCGYLSLAYNEYKFEVKEVLKHFSNDRSFFGGFLTTAFW